MKKTSVKVINVMSVLAWLLSATVAIGVPLGYFVLAYQYQTAVLKTELAGEASEASQMIGRNPDYWRFEQHRLQEFLSQRPFGQPNEIRRIVDVNHTVVAENADAIDAPLITRSHDLHDSGKMVARMEISRSLRPLLARTLLLLAFGLLLGAAVFIVLRVFPLRALSLALQSLQESEVKFRAIASTAADAIIVMDDHGVITYWNSAAEKIFGYTAHEAVGRELHRLIATPKYHESFEKGFKNFKKSGSGPAVGNISEFIAVRKDGTEFPIEVSTSAIRMSAVWHAVGIVRDVSERKKTELELLKLEKLESLGVLAGGLAHDFNNLLTVIKGGISLLMLDMKEGSSAYDRLAIMDKAVERSQDLTRQFLTFAKGGAPVKKTVSLPKIIEESCRFSLSGSNVNCAFFFGKDLSPADVDTGQIGQVISNLVLNAVQAMPDGGTIEVRADNVAVGPRDALPLVPGDYIRTSIHDRGAGIPREYLSKIFDPYFTTKGKGSGLGLTTSYSIAKRHGGYLAVESALGKGSVFHLYLPASHREPSAGESQDLDTPVVKGRAKILVMDDETVVRHVAGDMLKAIGYECEFAKDGVEAIELYRRSLDSGWPFDAVIMDLTVPGGMGGKEAVRKLIEIDPKAKVIVASGYSNDPIMADFSVHGFSGVIAKPYDLHSLSRALLAVLS